MYYGVAYYPEHWPEERWPLDAQMMQAAGLNGVRMGEFAWSKLEPVPGRYDFDWLDRSIELLGRHGVQTMMCTPSRTPPPWVFKKYPSIRNVRADRLPANYGYRYTVCHNNPDFMAAAQEIDRRVIEHYAGNENVVAWHIDNEIGSGNTCYCPICHARFKEYLREKYGTVDRLNEAWGMHFWSIAFTDFDEVPLPVGVPFAYPSLALEYARFQSHTNAEFARWRYQLMKRLRPQAWVTTNFQTSNATHTDIFEMGVHTDVYGTNFYPIYAPEFALDYCRGARNALIILEQRSGAPHFMPATHPGWMRLWAYRSIAHGATGMNFFRWRTARWGQEEYWHGVLPHSGRANRRYRELQQMGAEMKKVGGVIDQTRVEAQVAVVLSYESRWALGAVSSSGVLPAHFAADALNAHEEAKAYHGVLMGMNVTTDAMDPREDLSRYRLVIAPRLYVVDGKIASNLVRYVEQGGVLCLTPRSGVADEFNVIFDHPAPGPLAKIAGVLVDDYTTLEQPIELAAVPGQALFGAPNAPLRGELWADEIELNGAVPVAEYGTGWLKGMPAVTVHPYGKGKVVYVGTLLRGETLQAFAAWLTKEAGVKAVLATPPGVSAHERLGGGMRVLFLLNHGEEAREVKLDGEYEDLLAGGKINRVILPAAAVAILKQ
jgi:beta-galactosidase